MIVRHHTQGQTLEQLAIPLLTGFHEDRAERQLPAKKLGASTEL